MREGVSTFGGLHALDQITDPVAAERIRRELTSADVDAVTRASQKRFYKRTSADSRKAAEKSVPKPPGA